MGAPSVLPIPPLAGQIMFWGGAIALTVTLVWPLATRILRRGTTDALTRIGKYGVSLSEAAIYISQQSKWMVDHRDDELWALTLGKDMRDQLSLGNLKAISRQTSYLDVNANSPLTEIPREHWRSGDPWIIDGLAGNATANRSGPIDRPGSYYDIRVDVDDLRRIWPPLGPIQRWRVKPLKVK